MHKHKFCNMINMHEVSVTVCCLCDPVGRNFLLYRIIENRSLLLLGACTNIYLIVDFHTHTQKHTPLRYIIEPLYTHCEVHVLLPAEIICFCSGKKPIYNDLNYLHLHMHFL